MKTPRESIVSRTSIGVAAVVGIICAIAFTILYTVQKGIYEDRLSRDTETAITKINFYLLGYFYIQGNWPHMEEHQKFLETTPDTIYSYVVDSSGNIVLGTKGFTSPDIGQRRQSWEPEIRADSTDNQRFELVADSKLEAYTRGRVKAGQRIILFALPILAVWENKPAGQLRVAIAFESIQGTLASLRRSLILLGLFLTLSSALVAFLITRWNLAPLREISERMRYATAARSEGTNKVKLEAVLPHSPADAEETRFLKETLREFTKMLERSSRLEAEVKVSQSLADMAAQVSHDIRSPVSALTMVLHDLKGVPEEKRVLLTAVANRITDIANQLLRRQPRAVPAAGSPTQETESASSCLLTSLSEALLSEKRLQYRQRGNIRIETKFAPSSYGLFALVQPSEFKRVLSNLVDNAIEATPGQGHIYVSVAEHKADQVVISVRDEGNGIAPEMVSKILERGGSVGKPGGLGLGLSHAKGTVERWGGRVELQSEVGKGTTVDLILPKTAPPSWFLPKLSIPFHSTVLILDDDAVIHEIWRRRIENETSSVDVLSFFEEASFKAWCKEHGSKGDWLLLCDYELGDGSRTGTEIIESMGLVSKSVLVTNHTESPRRDLGDVIHTCTQLGLSLLPKTMATLVPIEFVDPKNCPGR